MTTRVIFCKLEGQVIAVFVDELWSGLPKHESYRSSYQHVGQHGAFSVELFDRRHWDSKQCEILTNPADYQDLLDELVSIGYNDLVVITKYKRIKKNESLG